MLREVRVQAAGELLAETDQTLAAVAAACGFCDQSYMTHVFRDLRGMTPKQYREQSRTAISPNPPA
jgi:AraC family transcriptional regulator